MTFGGVGSRLSCSFIPVRHLNNPYPFPSSMVLFCLSDMPLDFQLSLILDKVVVSCMRGSLVTEFCRFWGMYCPELKINGH